MKILEVLPILNTGGAEVFVVNLCNEFVNQNNSVTLLLFYDSENSFLRKRLSPKVKVEYIFKKKGLDISLFFKIYKYIKKNNFDAVHFHVNSIIYGLISSIKLKKCNFFATIHNDAYKEANGIHRFIRRIMFRRHLVHPITISKYSDQSFKELYKTNSTIIYNGIPQFQFTPNFSLNKFRKGINTKIIVSVASIHPVKNELAVARAINKLGKDGYDISLIIVGRYSDKEYSQLVVKESSEFVYCIGEVNNPTDYMKESDFFILASHYEGLPISLLEAMSIGCIPLVTPVGGCAELISNLKNGFIIPSPSEENIYNTIKDILDKYPYTYSTIKQDLIINSQQYNIKNCALKHLQIFENK